MYTSRSFLLPALIAGPGLLLAAVFVGGIYVTSISRTVAPQPSSVQVSMTPAPLLEPPRIAPAVQPVATTSIYAAVRTALIAAGVDEDKIDRPAADLSAAIEANISGSVNELWFYVKILAGSLVPLWIVALVALFRHQRERVDLSHLENIVRQASLVAAEADYDAPLPFVRRR